MAGAGHISATPAEVMSEAIRLFSPCRPTASAPSVGLHHDGVKPSSCPRSDQYFGIRPDGSARGLGVEARGSGGLAGIFLVAHLEPGNRSRVRQRGGVAERFAGGNVPEQAAHDLARTGLRQIGGEQDVVGPGDGAKRDADGYFWLLGRVDDVINVAGHRIGTMEVESALVDHPAVAEAAVVGRAHEIKGQAIAAFVTLKEGPGAIAQSKQLIDELKQHVVTKIGAIARPDDILFTADLPKTRSGKIMRRLLRDIAEGKALGDTTTLADPAVVAKLKTNYEEEYGS